MGEGGLLKEESLREVWRSSEESEEVWAILEWFQEVSGRRTLDEKSERTLVCRPLVVQGGDTNINEAVDGHVKLPRDWEDRAAMSRG